MSTQAGPTALADVKVLGEHTEAVLGDWAGMSKAEIAEYVKETPMQLGKRK